MPEDLIEPNELIKIFEKFGPVTTARIIKKVTGKNADDTPIYKSKGSAFVLFETQVGAFWAVDANPIKFNADTEL